MKKQAFSIPLFLSVLGALVFFSAGPAPAEGRRVREAILSNGLKVLLVEEHKAPVATFQIWYRVGSRNEVTGKTGLSHLAEHMMFKGTERYGKGEFSRIVAKNGGTENAFTGNDYTAYFENFASDRISLSLELEADRMENLLIDPTEFHLERDVVKEERRLRVEDDPSSLLFEQLYATAFLVHPYHSPVIGWMTDLDNLVREDIVGHYKTHYVPNNAVIVVVGDFEAEALFPQIKRHFEPILRGPDPPPVKTEEPPQRGERRIIVKKEAERPVVLLAYRVPNFRDPDTYSLTILSQILSAGKSSRLYQGLVRERQIALDVGGEYDELSADPPLFVVSGTARPGQNPHDLEKAILEELEQIKREPVQDRELQKAKNQVEAAYLLGQDSNFFVAMQIGRAEMVGAGYQFNENYVENIRRVTKEDLLRVARKYLIEDTRTVGVLIPQPLGEGKKERE